MSIYVNQNAEFSGSYRDAGGAFELEGFTPGEWFVEAGARGHARSERQRGTVPDARLLELAVPREVRVSGVVLDGDGEPCADAEIEVERPDERSRVFPGMSDRSGAQGTFELDGLAPGRTQLFARSPVGTTSEPLALELVAGQAVADVVLRLRAGATVTGEVLDRAGRPVVGVQVHVGTSDASYRPPHTTDATGRFVARGLPPGRAHVYAMEVDGMQVSSVVMLAEGDSAHVVLTPPRTATVRMHGRITADGAPLARARLGASSSGPPPPGGGHVSSNAGADAEGRYEVTLPGPGTYRIWVNAPSLQSFNWATVVEVPPVAEHAFDVAIALGRISGRVTRASGEPLRGAWINAQSARVEGPQGHGGCSSHGRAETGEDGRYEILLPTGTYTVTAGGDRRGFDAELEVVAGMVQDLALDAGGHLRGIDFALASGGVLVGEVTATFPLADRLRCTAASPSSFSGTNFSRSLSSCSAAASRASQGPLPEGSSASRRVPSCWT
jgi:protocatechuate 3,4-dioxygenase beta subunit